MWHSSTDRIVIHRCSGVCHFGHCRTELNFRHRKTRLRYDLLCVDVKAYTLAHSAEKSQNATQKWCDRWLWGKSWRKESFKTRVENACTRNANKRSRTHVGTQLKLMHHMLSRKRCYNFHSTDVSHFEPHCSTNMSYNGRNNGELELDGLRTIWMTRNCTSKRSDHSSCSSSSGHVCGLVMTSQSSLNCWAAVL